MSQDFLEFVLIWNFLLERKMTEMFPGKKAVNSGFSFSIATHLSGEKSVSLFSDLSNKLRGIRTLLNICGAFHHLLLFPMDVVNDPIKSSL